MTSGKTETLSAEMICALIGFVVASCRISVKMVFFSHLVYRETSATSFRVAERSTKTSRGFSTQLFHFGMRGVVWHHAGHRLVPLKSFLAVKM